MQTSSHYLTPDQISDLLGVTKRTVRNLTAKGLIPTIKLTGKIVRYDRQAVERAMAKLTVGIAR